jgi:hypothetical protein
MTARPGLETAARRLGGELSGGEVRCPGPGHSDQDRSLSVKLDDRAPDGFVVCSFAGDDPVACRDHVRGKLGLPPFEPGKKKNGGGAAWTLVSEHSYRDEAGAPYLRVCKYFDDKGKKQYPQSHWVGSKWAKGKPKGPKLPYRLPELLAASANTLVHIAEGEKCCDALAKLGFVATTNSEGAGKWSSDLNKHFKGRNVVIIGDNDQPGRKHVEHVAKSLHGVAETVRTLDLAQHWPGDPMPQGDDVADWIERHDRAGTRLAQLAKDAPLWEPDAKPAGDAGDGGEQSKADAEIARLAKLSTVQYERERKAAAERLEVRASILDRLVEAERNKTGQPSDKHGQGRPISLLEPQPWPDPVDGAELLDGLAAAIRQYVVVSDHASDAAALWVVHTYLVDQFLVSPRLCLRSPVMQCGKTTLLDVLGHLVLRPLLSANATVAAIFRVIEAHQPTLLLDEGETFINNDNSELRGILNSGHRQGGAVLRVVGDDHEPRSFSTFGACVIALIGTLPGTLHDRSVTINLKRKLAGERVESFRHDCTGHLDTLARRIARWAQDHAERIADIDPDLPPGLANREADNWRPLLAIAVEASGEWPERARKAATQAQIAGAADADSRLELLLGHVRGIFAARNEDRISSADLVASLVELEGGPWAEMGHNRKPLSQNMLARMLKPVGIAPETVRIGDKTPKAYLLAAFRDAFERYLAPEGGSQPQHRNKCDDSNTSEAFATATQASDVAVVKCEKSNNDELCCGVAVVEGVSGEERHSPPLGRCAQCNGDKADAPLVTGIGYPPTGVHLHRECRRFWCSHV